MSRDQRVDRGRSPCSAVCCNRRSYGSVANREEIPVARGFRRRRVILYQSRAQLAPAPLGTTNGRTRRMSSGASGVGNVGADGVVLVGGGGPASTVIRHRDAWRQCRRGYELPARRRSCSFPRTSILRFAKPPSRSAAAGFPIESPVYRDPMSLSRVVIRFISAAGQYAARAFAHRQHHGL